MNITTGNATKIVNEISTIIGQHVNMMDGGGFIIASTDPQRVGTYHEGAAKIIAERLDELIIQQDDAYSGTRKGINLPIVFNGDIVGVVGVTGERDEVVKYGRLIKKMTEILLLESSLVEQEKLDERIRTRFLDACLFEDVPCTPQFIERGRHLGIDITLPRRVMIAEIQDLQKHSDSPEGQRLIDTVNATVRRLVERHRQNLFTRTSSQMIALIDEQGGHRARSLAEDIQRQLAEKFAVRVNIGISGSSKTLHAAYVEAKKALLSFTYSPGGSIKFYDDLNIELFIDEISVEAKATYIRRIFNGFTDEEITLCIHLLEVYFFNNGSIQKTAEALFMHKNTLQYKLRKVYEKTGYDPRNLIDAALFFCAVRFHHDLTSRARS